eukprot:4490049-Amphidinium_carterae.1
MLCRCYPVVSPSGSVVNVVDSVVLIVAVQVVVQLMCTSVCCAGLVPVSLDSSIVVGMSRVCGASAYVQVQFCRYNIETPTLSLPVPIAGIG